MPPPDEPAEPEDPGVSAWAPGEAAEGLRPILNALPAMVAYWDRELHNRLANDAYVEYFGWSPERMRGRHIREVLGEELFARNRPFMEAALQGEAQLFDREIVTPTGEVRFTQASYIPDSADGVVRGFFVLATDITARRRAELALHASEERYRTLVDHLPRSAITLVGPDLNLRLLSGSVVHAPGLDAEAFVGTPVAAAAGGGEHGARVARLYGRALSGEVVSEELHSQITGRDFSVEIAPLRNPDGSIEAALGVAQDITDRKRADAELRLQSQITANMAEGALLIRASDLVIEHANARTEAMFGYDAGELVGRHVSVLDAATSQTPRQVAVHVASHVQDEAGRWSGEVLSVRKDGTRFWRRSTISRFDHPELGPLLVSVLDDVTDRRERQAEETALAAIATLVAQGAGPTEVFRAVADEIRGLFECHTAGLIRFDTKARRAEVLGGQTWQGADLVGLLVDLEGESATAEVFRTGRPARCSYSRLPVDLRQLNPSQTAVTGAIGAPIEVGGVLWGAVAAAFSGSPVPPAAELRLARFARLVSLAIANAAAWETLAREASTDAVTGLANHRTFHDRLGAEVERARRYRRDLSLVLLDLDHFKQVHDVHGHQVGDRVLAEVARRLSAQARDGELVARIGGEEFAWLLPETTSEAALIAADRMRRAIESEAFEVAGALTISAGVCSSEHVSDAEELVRFADRALYRAKDSGRNTTFVYTGEGS